MFPILTRNTFLKTKRISIYISEMIYTVMMQYNVSKKCRVFGIIRNKQIIRRNKSLNNKKKMLRKMLCILVF